LGESWGWYVPNPKVGLLGATSLVGKCLVLLLINSGVRVCAFSRQSIKTVGDGITWRNLSDSRSTNTDQLDHWICVAPIWVLPEHFPLMEASGARRVVVLSSTSRFTKVGSGDTAETAVAARLIEAENRFVAWAKSHGIEWVILRPTLIYGLGRDKNISEIARFIRRFSFFPVFGQADGLRQPIHAEDVALACVSALQAPDAANRAYNLSGGETLTYRDMVARVFVALDCRPRLLTVPLWSFRLALSVLRCLPRYRQWSAAMAERMNRDLVFDHTEAARDLGFKPRGFALAAEDFQG
jgi:nucleoside-diphosphate-sugar epimerase